MILNVPTLQPSTSAPIESEVSLARLYVLRAMYLLLVVGGGIAFLPQLIGHEPTARGGNPEYARRIMGACLFRTSLPAADASDTSLRTGVEDNLARRLRATGMEGRRAYDPIHRGSHIDRAGRDRDPDHPVEICLAALPEGTGGALALDCRNPDGERDCPELRLRKT